MDNQMSSLVVEDVLEELREENNKNFQKIRFFKEVLTKLIEFKIFIQFISHKIKTNLDSNELKRFEDLNEELSKTLREWQRNEDKLLIDNCVDIYDDIIIYDITSEKVIRKQRNAKSAKPLRFKTKEDLMNDSNILSMIPEKQKTSKSAKTSETEEHCEDINSCDETSQTDPISSQKTTKSQKNAKSAKPKRFKTKEELMISEDIDKTIEESIQMNVVLEELIEENKRIFKELLFANKCFTKLIEFQTFIELISNKLKSTLNSLELKTYEDLCYESTTKPFANHFLVENNEFESSMMKIKYKFSWITRSKTVERISSLNQMSNETNIRSDFNCDFCDQTFKSEKELSVHSKQHSLKGELEFQCEEPNCSYKTNNRHKLKQHSVVHSSDKPFVCEVNGCGVRFKRKNHLNAHIKCVHSSIAKQFVCDYPECEHRFAYLKDLKDHQKMIHLQSEKFACQVCGKVFLLKKLLTRHMKVSKCTKIFTQMNKESTRLDKTIDEYSSFETNISKNKETNDSIISEDSSLETEVTINSSENEDLSQLNEKSMDNNPENNNEVVVNEEYSLRFSVNNDSNSRENERENSNQELNEDSNDRKSLYEKQGEKVKYWYRKDPSLSLSQLRQKLIEKWPNIAVMTRPTINRYLKEVKHSVKGVKKTPFTESEDFQVEPIRLSQRKSPKTRNNLKQLSPEGELEFICGEPNCSYKTNRRTKLNDHSAVHTTDKPFLCGVKGCGGRFKSKNYLRKHMKYGHSVKNCYCEWPGCDYATSYPRNLTLHKRRVHLKLKPNSNNQCKKCDWPGCDYVGSHMSQHKLTHLEYSQREFVCDWPECGKRFAKRWNLKTHLRIHRNEKKFVCDWPGCDYKCVDSCNLIKHMRRYHKTK